MLPLSVCTLMNRNDLKDFVIYLNWYVLIYLFQDNSLIKRKLVKGVIQIEFSLEDSPLSIVN